MPLHVLLVGETKVHDDQTPVRGASAAPHTLACRLDNVSQVQEYADIIRVRFGFLVTNQELVLLHFCADSQEHTHGAMPSSPASTAVLASPDRLTLLQQTPTIITPRALGPNHTPRTGHAWVPQSSRVTAI